jgi:hypothetical protein
MNDHTTNNISLQKSLKKNAKYVRESQDNIKIFMNFVAAKLIQIFFCAYCCLYLIAKSITHTESLIINTDDLLCLQLHTLGQVHPTFYGVWQNSANFDLHADNMISLHKTKDN